MNRPRALWSGLTPFVALAVSLMGGWSADAQETLRWKFREGQRLNYTISQTMDMQMTVMGMDARSRIAQTMDMEWVVRGVAEDGTATIGQTLRRVRFKMDGGALAGRFEYDSEKKEEIEGPVAAATAKTYDALVGGEFTVKMTPLGNVRVVELPRTFTDLLEDDPTLTSQPGALTGDTFKQLMSQSGVVFPKEPVKEGETWTNKVEINAPFGRINLESRMESLGTEKQVDRALEKIAVSPRMSIKATERSPFTIELTSFDGSGTVLFDNAAGHIVESTLKQKFAMTIESDGNTVKQTIDQTVKMERVPEKPGLEGEGSEASEGSE